MMDKDNTLLRNQIDSAKAAFPRNKDVFPVLGRLDYGRVKEAML